MASSDLQKKSAKLIQEVQRCVEEEFPSERHVVLVYGSYAYELERADSDLDLLMIADTADEARRNRMEAVVLELHMRHNLTVDDEVPHRRKLVATWKDMEAAVKGAGFEKKERRLVATPIVKTSQFLESEEIRLRLFLNAVTGRSLFVAGDPEALTLFQRRARQNWVRVLPLLVGIRKFSTKSFVDHLIGVDERKGEWFLGFKDHPAVRAYLEGIFASVVMECVRFGWLRERTEGYEIVDYKWLYELAQ